ncbi:MAG: 4-hydroxy-tetrahydrodipicolinate synthase [Furfurilactobacillus sp.]|uniref:4-hydroxy-tetrahydrodipicolinate synthase n=1 Tax=Furfurilactobacillus milii TaxID=2888272 RepID=A0ABT6DCI5_9LACO|nr:MULTISPECIES: 4-hydroxy-tetrahydrodipicolinate synthase [Furfurilactobacillus]QLE67572.1 Dihydrodipicolinate synthase [Furfurilactobacillus rossiae]MCF6161372.1 4-hydroxy-tetrahydrodipicolinate synthase [Furfurilactobacillus milii]MCF6163752.1 4-hydroxy-tetrahydrodipicolinate synthase [Furfurilactobacillus milii]MCF6419570.1 4-hydroxy-tetrahydrodipicolinate synthase [Furfurilactobacillus milii]MCH4011701.1 4-hydroxy-tetrahydrodipicolinate synthase [Furfurilactobacillus sp.]
MFEQHDLLTAIITPFTEDDHIDFEALTRLTNMLIETGSRGFVIGGTTGETPTLTHDEKIELYTRFAQIVAGRGVVIAGTGSNNTAATIAFNQEVDAIDGIDATLVVVPYYNKPNQRGMIAHFTAVAQAATKPIVIYNIPGRTGVNMTNETILQLAQVPNISGVKQCGSDADLAALINDAPTGFAVYSGEDAQALLVKALGGAGVISVASHVYGPAMRQEYDALAQGNVARAGQIQRDLMPKMAALFMYPSPSPVKAVLNAQGLPVGNPRLPIVPLNDTEQTVLAQRLGVHELSDIPLAENTEAV